MLCLIAQSVKSELLNCVSSNSLSVSFTLSLESLIWESGEVALIELTSISCGEGKLSYDVDEHGIAIVLLKLTCSVVN